MSFEEKMKTLVASIVLISSALCRLTVAIDSIDGENPGKCPRLDFGDPNPSPSLVSECVVDTDCSGNDAQKCCADLSSGIRFCVYPERVCTPSVMYTLPDNPCRTCVCGDNGQPTEDCVDLDCPGPQYWCDPGQTAKQIEGSCCTFQCLGDPKVDTAHDDDVEDYEDYDDYILDHPLDEATNDVDEEYDNSDYNDESGSSSGDYDYSGAYDYPGQSVLTESVCTPGQFDYYPDDPCLAACLCDEDGRPTDICIHQCDDYDTAVGPTPAPSIPAERDTPAESTRPDYTSTQSVIPEVCRPGEFYTFPDDPCTSCLCGDDGRPTDECEFQECYGPRVDCAPGQINQYVEGTCCDYRCVRDPKTTVKPSVCIPGDFMILPDDPCKTCLCGYDGQPTNQCADIYPPPECEPGSVLRRKEGTCGDYDCVDTSKQAPCLPGESYTFPDNPCLACTCYSGGPYECWVKTCPPTNCPSGQEAIAKPGTCCDYECYPAGESSGDYYYSAAEDDIEWHQSDCTGLPCMDPPTCDDGATYREVPSDSCCPEYECNDHDDNDDNENADKKMWTDEYGNLSWLSYVLIALGFVTIVGSVFALVIFCIRKKKNMNVAESRGEQYYNNLTQEYDDNMSIIPDKLEIVKESNYTKDEEGVIEV